MGAGCLRLDFAGCTTCVELGALRREAAGHGSACVPHCRAGTRPDLRRKALGTVYAYIHVYLYREREIYIYMYRYTRYIYRYTYVCIFIYAYV